MPPQVADERAQEQTGDLPIVTVIKWQGGELTLIAGGHGHGHGLSISPAHTRHWHGLGTGSSSLCLISKTKLVRVPTSQSKGEDVNSRDSAHHLSLLPLLLWWRLWFIAENLAQTRCHQERAPPPKEEEKVWLDRPELSGAGLQWARPGWGQVSSDPLGAPILQSPTTGQGTECCQPLPTLPHVSTWPPCHGACWVLCARCQRALSSTHHPASQATLTPFNR